MKLIIKRKGFTLAEVLITLGIIGIVASMTLPALTAKYRKRVIETRLKKFYTVMTQAIILSEEDNGPTTDWQLKAADYELDENNEISETALFYNKYLAKYLKTITQKRANLSDKSLLVYLNDGTAFKVSTGDCADFQYIIKPSKLDKTYLISNLTKGRDYFTFRLCPSAGGYYAGGTTGFAPSVNSTNKKDREDRDFLLKNCKTPPADGETCTALIMHDGWEIKADYPVKY